MATTQTTTTRVPLPAGNQRGFNYLADALTTLKTRPITERDRDAATRQVHAYAQRHDADAAVLLDMIGLTEKAVA